MNLLTFFILWAAINFDLAARNELYSTSDCTCPGQNVTYVCSIIGGKFTVWDGSIMEGNCTIALLHSQFESDTGSCNMGSNTVVAQGVRVENNCYISQLTIFAIPDFDGRTIECYLDDGPMNVSRIGTTTLTLTRAPFSPPSNLQLTDAMPSKLIFTWIPPPQKCPSLTFNITSENCGVCESTSTQTNSTSCSNFTLPAVCTMKVYSMICGNITSLSSSNVVNATLKVLEAPLIIECVPHYSESDNKLLSIQTNFSTVEPFPISGGVDGSATNYTLSYTDNMGISCDSVTVSPSSCENEVCTHLFEVSTSPCSLLTGIYVTVFATNMLGNGSHAKQIFNDGLNRLVKVEFNSNTKNFNCTFLNEPQDSLKECLANLSYGANCENHLRVYTSSGQGNVVVTEPAVELLDGIAQYCFTVQASSGNKTVVVNGTFTFGLGNRPIITAEVITAIVVLAIIIIIINVTGGGITLLLLVKKYRQGEDRLVITKFSSKQDIESLLSVLNVFKDLKINIIGFNAYCETTQRKEVHVHLRCKKQDKQTLERTLPSAKFVDNEILSTVEEVYTTAILSLKDELGALWKSLKTIRDSRIELEIKGVNTWSTQATADGYKDTYVTCLGPIKSPKISDKLMGVGARNINTEFVTPMPDKIFMFTRKKVSMLIKALQIFGDLNINVIGLDNDDQEFEDRKYHVACRHAEGNQTNSGEENLTDSVFGELKCFGAKEVEYENCEDACHVEFTVRDEIGSLAAVLQGFHALKRKIISIGKRNLENKQVQYRSIQIECNDSIPKKDKLEEDLEATGFVNKPKIENSTDPNIRTKINFEIRHTPGALIEALKVLVEYKVNMTKIGNREDPIEVEYECHYVEFICTPNQKSLLVSKLEEAGVIIKESVSIAESNQLESTV